MAGEDGSRFGSRAHRLLELYGPNKMEGNVFQKDVGGIGGKSLTKCLNEGVELFSNSLLRVAASRSQEIHRIQLQRMEKEVIGSRVTSKNLLGVVKQKDHLH